MLTALGFGVGQQLLGPVRASQARVLREGTGIGVAAAAGRLRRWRGATAGEHERGGGQNDEKTSALHRTSPGTVRWGDLGAGPRSIRGGARSPPNPPKGACAMGTVVVPGSRPWISGPPVRGGGWRRRWTRPLPPPRPRPPAAARPRA